MAQRPPTLALVAGYIEDATLEVNELTIIDVFDQVANVHLKCMARPSRTTTTMACAALIARCACDSHASGHPRIAHRLAAAVLHLSPSQLRVAGETLPTSLNVFISDPDVDGAPGLLGTLALPPIYEDGEVYVSVPARTEGIMATASLTCGHAPPPHTHTHIIIIIIIIVIATTGTRVRGTGSSLTSTRRCASAQNASSTRCSRASSKTIP